MEFRQDTGLHIIQHLFSSYGAIDKIYPRENSVKMMGPYDPAEPFTPLINPLEKVKEFSRAGGKTINNVMMVSKGITILAQIARFNDDVK